MRIGELSRRTGVSIRSLRYYEEQGLLTPARRPSGYREFADSDVERVERISELLAAGLSTEKIAVVLPCLDEHTDGLALACEDLYDELVEVREGMLERIARLSVSVDALESVISASPRPDAHS